MSLPWLQEILHGCEANLAARQQEAERTLKQAEAERQAQAQSLDEQIAAAVAAAMQAQTSRDNGHSPQQRTAAAPPQPPDAEGLASGHDHDPSWCPKHEVTMRWHDGNAVPIYRVTLVRESRLPHTQPQLRSSRDAAVLFRQYLGEVDREHFRVAMLDQKHKVIGINTVSMGSLTASVVHPREVMKPAILSNAAALLCCHNHPSGAPQPSQEDRALTKRLVDAGQLLGIHVIDHIILGDGSETYYSFADEGLLP